MRCKGARLEGKCLAGACPEGVRLEGRRLARACPEGVRSDGAERERSRPEGVRSEASRHMIGRGLWTERRELSVPRRRVVWL
ncbi:predicted protein [Streptomyces sp. SPB78]|nr:predicted protein [Streptomyces sp. SPB78]